MTSDGRSSGTGSRTARSRFPPWLRHGAVEVTGWLLVAAGLAALVLPGPGLLFLVAGLALLSLHYAWARRLLRPVRSRAFVLAAKGVQTWPRIVSSLLGALVIVGLGVLWGVGTPAPGWWPVDDRWWLPGGWGVGATLIFSGVLALGTIVYSWIRFRERPGAAASAVRGAGARGVSQRYP